MSEPAADPRQLGEGTEDRGNVVKMIEALYERRHKIKTLVVGTVDAGGSADVGLSAPLNVVLCGHLVRMLNVRVDRHYARGMFQPQPGPPSGVKPGETQARIPRAVRREIEKARRKQKKAAGNEVPQS